MRASLCLVSSERLSTLSNFGSNPGALQAQFYLPDSLSEGAPLVVVLHGCTQTAAGYDHMSGWSQLADEAGFALLYPEQQRANNPNLCFNWFLPTDAGARSWGGAFDPPDDRSNDGHARPRSKACLRNRPLGRRRDGRGNAGKLSEVFAGGGIIAGLPYGSATSIPEAFDRMRGHGGPSEQDLQRLLQRASTHRGPWPRISIWHGSSDQTVAPSNADAIASQWRGVHGLETAPTHQAASGRSSKQVWLDDAGNAVIEINMIAGMGHGTPLDDHLGTPGPYMLDVGISSTREIARFWGLLDESASFA